MSTDRRTLTLMDLMIIVAATGVGLAAAKAFEPDSLLPRHGKGYYPYYTWTVDGPLTFLIVAWSAALIVARSCHPRPRPHRLLRQPGFIACAATLASVAWGLACVLALEAIHAPQPNVQVSRSLSQYSLGARQDCPEFVAGCLTALCLVGRPRPSPDWVDRAGRLVAFYWVARFALRLVMPIVGPFLGL